MQLDAMKSRLVFPDTRGMISALLHMNLLGERNIFSNFLHVIDIIRLYMKKHNLVHIIKICNLRIKNIYCIISRFCCFHSNIYLIRFYFIVSEAFFPQQKCSRYLRHKANISVDTRHQWSATKLIFARIQIYLRI